MRGLDRGSTPQPGAEPLGPTETNLGRLAHRGLFRLIAATPAPLRDRLRRRIFERVFATEDPWGYTQLSYELRKSQALLAAVPLDSRVVIELGCAQGHLTAKLAEKLPQALVVGVDLSPTALRSARDRVRDHNCEFLLADAAGLSRAWGARPKSDLLVISEVLYYLGGPRRVTEALESLAPILLDDAQIVLLHLSRDAPTLHAAAVEALGAEVVIHHPHQMLGRPFTITTARRG